MIKYLIILFLIIPNIASARYIGTEEWVSIYIKLCVKNAKPGIQCLGNTKKMLSGLDRHKRMIFSNLDEYGLERWLGTIPLIESGVNSKARSSASAIGLWQIMPLNLIYHLTERTRHTAVILGWKRTVITIKKPTLKKAIKLGSRPEISTEIACKILSHLYKKYSNHKLVDKADLDKVVVMAYNAGETRIDKWLIGEGKPLMPETVNYFYKLRAIQALIDDMYNGNSFGLR